MKHFLAIIFLSFLDNVALAGTSSCPMATLATTGCSQVDITFSNIALGTENGNWTSAPGLPDIDFAGSGGAIMGNPSTIGTIDATITSPNATSSSASGDAGPGWYVNGKKNAAGSVSFLAAANNGTSSSAPVTPAGDVWILSSLDLVINSFGTDATGTATVTETFCLNGAAIGGCASAATGSITATIGNNSALSYTWVLGSHSGSGDSINLLANFTGEVTSVFVNNAVAMSDNTGSSYLNNFTDGFSQEETSLEPPSMLLVGGALCAVVAVRRGRHRSSSRILQRNTF